MRYIVKEGTCGCFILDTNTNLVYSDNFKKIIYFTNEIEAIKRATELNNI